MERIQTVTKRRKESRGRTNLCGKKEVEELTKIEGVGTVGLFPVGTCQYIAHIINCPRAGMQVQNVDLKKQHFIQDFEALH